MPANLITCVMDGTLKSTNSCQLTFKDINVQGKLDDFAHPCMKSPIPVRTK